MSSITIGDTIYNLDNYRYIAFNPNIPSWKGDEYHFLAFRNDDEEEFQNATGYDDLDDTSRGFIDVIVDTYLKLHPEKKVGFDGCCFYYQ